MRIKVNLSGNFLSDILRFSIASSILLVSMAALGNRGPVVFGDLERNYIGNILEGPDAGATIDAEGVSVVQEWIEDRTKPSINPIHIFWQHIRFRSRKSEADLVLTLNTRDNRKNDRKFYIQMEENRLYLVFEPFGFNRVLFTDFDASTLSRELEKHIID